MACLKEQHAKSMAKRQARIAPWAKFQLSTRLMHVLGNGTDGSYQEALALFDEVRTCKSIPNFGKKTLEEFTLAVVMGPKDTPTCHKVR